MALHDWVRVDLFCPFCGEKTARDWQTNGLIGGIFTFKPKEIINILNGRENNKEIEINTICIKCSKKISINTTVESFM